MKIRKNKQKYPKKILIVTTILLLLLGVSAYVFISSSESESQQEDAPSKKSDTPKSSSAQGQDLDTLSQDSASDSELDSNHQAPLREAEKDAVVQYEGVNSSNPSSLSGTITHSAVAGDKLIIRTNIDQRLNAGTCLATLTNGSKTVTKSSAVAQNPSSSTCEGFDIPVSELGVGRWNISIEAASGDRRGVLTGEVNI